MLVKRYVWIEIYITVTAVVEEDAFEVEGMADRYIASCWRLSSLVAIPWLMAERSFGWNVSKINGTIKVMPISLQMEVQKTSAGEPVIDRQAIALSNKFLGALEPWYTIDTIITVIISYFSLSTNDLLRAAIEDEARLEVSVTVMTGDSFDLCLSFPLKNRLLIVLYIRRRVHIIKGKLAGLEMSTTEKTR